MINPNKDIKKEINDNLIIAGSGTVDASTLKASILSGSVNKIYKTNKYSAIIGGNTNLIQGYDDGGGQVKKLNSGLIVGGVSNSLDIPNTSAPYYYLNNDYATIVGGKSNTIRAGAYSFIGAGISNTIDNLKYAPSDRSFIGSGNLNIITGSQRTFIGTGIGNKILAVDYGGTPYESNHSAIITGSSNEIRMSKYSAIITGKTNKIYEYNYNSSNYSMIGNGTGNKIRNHIHGFIGAGSNNYLSVATAPNGVYQSNFNSIVNGDTNIIRLATQCFIGSGDNNIITNPVGYEYTASTNSSLMNGIGNSIVGDRCFIGTGTTNQILPYTYNIPIVATIINGVSNKITNGSYNTIISGSANEIQNSGAYKHSHGFIGSGRLNTIQSDDNYDDKYSAIVSGFTNTVYRSTYGFIAGGKLNATAGFDNVFILGSNITATTPDTTFVENIKVKNHIGGILTIIGYNVTTTVADWNDSNFQKMVFGLRAIGTFDFVPPAGTPSGIHVLHIQQDAVGLREVTTWDTLINWVGGVKPPLSIGSNAVDIFTFFFDGTKWYEMSRSLDVK